jgi:hypothetical protein
MADAYGSLSGQVFDQRQVSNATPLIDQQCLAWR